MKLIATVVLGILSYSASAQSSQIGIETGAIASYSVNYFKDAQPVRFYKNWQNYSYDNSVFLRRETENSWAFQINVAYHHDKFTSSYENSVISNTLNYSLCIQHRLGQPGNKFKFFFGLSYTRLESYGYFSIANYFSTKCDWNDNLLGFNCWANYQCTQTLAIIFDLSTRLSLKYPNEVMDENGATVSGGYTDFHFDKPNLYYTFMVGISYTFDD